MVGVLCCCFAGAASGSIDNPRVATDPITVHTQVEASKLPGGTAERLIRRAETMRSIRVIVGIKTIMQMEHTLAPAQAQAQAAALSALQRGVAARVLGSPAAQSEDRFTFIPYMSMFVDAAQLRRLLADPDVTSVQEDVPVPPLLSQSEPIIHAPDVWAKGVNGANQVVAILDTGVDKTHSMLAKKVASEACYSTTNAKINYLSICPGGVNSSTAADSGVNCSTAWKGCDHGTHVAGIAAGNSSTLEGIAHNSRIISIQVFSLLTTATPNVVNSFSTDQVKGLQRVYDLRTKYNIAAVNMSLGKGSYSSSCDTLNPALTTAIASLRSAGIATIIASGNDGLTGAIGSPACISQAIAVGNTEKSDIVYGGASGSNHSDLVKLMAPGTSIKSAVPGEGYAFKTGTSMAAPHVAGAYALLRSAKTAATVDEILEALTCSGKVVHQRDVSAGSPIELSPQKPRIDLLAAYNFIRKPVDVTRSWPFSAAADQGLVASAWGMGGPFRRLYPVACRRRVGGEPGRKLQH